MNDKMIAMRNKPISLAIIAIAVGLLLGLFIAQTMSTHARADETVPFDHSNCQYPYRASNPSDGCDNSDPACPELIKGATRCPADTPAPIASITSAVPQPKNSCSE